MSDSLQPHEPQHVMPPCPSPTPRVYPNPCLLSRWCHPAISSSVVPFFCCPQSFPASGSFQMHQLFTSGGQNVGVSASTSVLPRNTQDWSPLGWTGWISLQRQNYIPLIQGIRGSSTCHGCFTKCNDIMWLILMKIEFHQICALREKLKATWQNVKSLSCRSVII